VNGWFSEDAVQLQINIAKSGQGREPPIPVETI
jgi:hypothetical protein